jgi:hypothetical protein
MRALPLLLAAFALFGCRCGVDPLERPYASLRVKPEEVHLTNIPVAQDTRIVIQMSNPRFVTLKNITASLSETGDPAFRIEEGFADEVFPGQVEELVVVVRPRVVSTIATVLTIEADEDARPNRAVIPITVEAIDAGLPDICDYTESVQFDPIGVGSVARASVQVCNCGIRDLTFDRTDVEALVDGDQSIRVINRARSLSPSGCITFEAVFAPTDLEEHCADFVIESNDPDESPLRIPMCGQAVQCPVACVEFLDEVDQIEPFDTVRLDAHCSTPSSDLPDAAPIESAEWTLEFRPTGSTAILRPTGDVLAAEIRVDLAGQYCARVHVFDTDGIRSCTAATQCFDVVPREDLHVQLVWDHDVADVDLHMVRGRTNAVFNHDTDVYFSNRRPEPVAPWSTNPDENPSLDVDDNRGYGPENINIVHPAGGSQWRVFVHYWNAQSEQKRTTATLRVFVYGQQVIELQRTFETDEQLWQALDIEWPFQEGAQPTISQIGVVEPFARPF